MNRRQLLLSAVTAAISQMFGVPAVTAVPPPLTSPTPIPSGYRVYRRGPDGFSFVLVGNYGRFPDFQVDSLAEHRRARIAPDVHRVVVKEWA